MDLNVLNKLYNFTIKLIGNCDEIAEKSFWKRGTESLPVDFDMPSVLVDET